MKKNETRAAPGAGSIAFLLAQVGGHAATKFAERLAPLGLTLPEAGILRAIGATSRLSQKALAEALSIFPSRLVQLVDGLEDRGLVERHDSPHDRRVYELRLSENGRQALEALGRAGRAHEEAFGAPLSASERVQLRALLTRIADHEGLTPGVHPGFRSMGPK